MDGEVTLMDRILKWLLVIFIVWDIGFSFYQHYHSPIGGDIAQVVLPTPDKGYFGVLQDPLGISVLKGERSYGNPNRFFVHWATSKYLLHAPQALQRFVQPTTSVYLSMALLKMLTQLALIFLVAYFSSFNRKSSSLAILMVLVLLSSLFQTSGYNRVMGIIDQSIVYTFSYALPMLVLGISLLPIVKWASNPIGYRISWFWFVVMLLLGFPLALGGPLIPGVALVGTFVLLAWGVWSFINSREEVTAFAKRHQRSILMAGFAIGWLCLLCLYSLLVGSQNSLNNLAGISLAERYAKLPDGIWGLFTNKLGPILLVIMVVVNTVLMSRVNPKNHENTIISFKWLALFIVIYILLLPLGGYRDYRPNILRYDTVMPATLVLFYMLGRSSLQLLSALKGDSRRYFQLTLLAVLIIFSVADTAKTEAFCFEYAALQQIAESKEMVVELDNTYPVMEFRIVHEPDHSNLKAALLTRWNVTDHDKLFYQRK